MVVLILLLLFIIIFTVAVISPRKGKKIQHETNQKTHRLKIKSDYLWNPLTKWARSGLEFSRKSIRKASKLGKKLRHQLPF